MTDMTSRDSYETYRSDSSKPLRVSVCTSSSISNVQGFINELSTRFPNMNLDVQYCRLPYNDIDSFTFKGDDVNIMILCHSINNRRFAITDVKDALYDKFLARSANILGKLRICVIAHDFPKDKGLDNPKKYEAEIDIFRSKQPTAFKKSNLVMMCGKLEGPVELQESNWDALRRFLKNAAKSPMPNLIDIEFLQKYLLEFWKKYWLLLPLFPLLIIIFIYVVIKDTKK